MTSTTFSQPSVSSSSSSSSYPSSSSSFSSSVFVDDFIYLRPTVQRYAWGVRGFDSLVGQLFVANASLDLIENENFNNSITSSSSSSSTTTSTTLDSSVPYAELWVGIHKSGMAEIFSTHQSLEEFITTFPHFFQKSSHISFPPPPTTSVSVDELLPFLLKILSVSSPLSIQAHPDSFTANQLHHDFPNIYRDPNPKPEMCIALSSSFEVLCGFRPLREIAFFLVNVAEFRAAVGEEFWQRRKLIFMNLLNSQRNIEEEGKMWEGGEKEGGKEICNGNIELKKEEEGREGGEGVEKEEEEEIMKELFGCLMRQRASVVENALKNLILRLEEEKQMEMSKITKKCGGVENINSNDNSNNNSNDNSNNNSSNNSNNNCNNNYNNNCNNCNNSNNTGTNSNHNNNNSNNNSSNNSNNNCNNCNNSNNTGTNSNHNNNNSNNNSSNNCNNSNHNNNCNNNCNNSSNNCNNSNHNNNCNNNCNNSSNNCNNSNHNNNNSSNDKQQKQKHRNKNGDSSSSFLSSYLKIANTLVLRLHHFFPYDFGVFAPYILNYENLKKGEAIFIGANKLHAYLFGDCLECMRNSDNVVRGGLTPKLKDVDLLCRILDYSFEGQKIHRIPKTKIEKIDFPSTTTSILSSSSSSSHLPSSSSSSSSILPSSSSSSSSHLPSSSSSSSSHLPSSSSSSSHLPSSSSSSSSSILPSSSSSSSSSILPSSSSSSSSLPYSTSSLSSSFSPGRCGIFLYSPPIEYFQVWEIRIKEGGQVRSTFGISSASMLVVLLGTGEIRIDRSKKEKKKEEEVEVEDEKDKENEGGGGILKRGCVMMIRAGMMMVIRNGRFDIKNERSGEKENEKKEKKEEEDEEENIIQGLNPCNDLLLYIVSKQN